MTTCGATRCCRPRPTLASSPASLPRGRYVSVVEGGGWVGGDRGLYMQGAGGRGGACLRSSPPPPPLKFAARSLRECGGAGAGVGMFEHPAPASLPRAQRAGVEGVGVGGEGRVAGREWEGSPPHPPKLPPALAWWGAHAHPPARLLPCPRCPAEGPTPLIRLLPCPRCPAAQPCCGRGCTSWTRLWRWWREGRPWRLRSWR